MIVSDPGTIIRQVPQGPRSCQRSVSQCHRAAVSGKSFIHGALLITATQFGILMRGRDTPEEYLAVH